MLNELLVAVLVTVFFVWFWQSSLGARERANRAAMQACGRMNLQFLDGTVAFTRLGLARNDQGRITLRRTYVFDYTATSIERRQGFVVLLGHRIESIGFESEQFHGGPTQRSLTDSPAAPHQDIPHSSDAQDSNVLDLQEWRRRHRSRSLGTRHSTSHDTPNDNGW
ncbi:MAG: DUF3301 domain-containing protein [Steroidobacteraceae bacterium]